MKKTFIIKASLPDVFNNADFYSIETDNKDIISFLETRLEEIDEYFMEFIGYTEFELFEPPVNEKNILLKYTKKIDETDILEYIESITY